jgi:hypothetical protein
MLRVGSMGLEQHQRRRSTVVGEKWRRRARVAARIRGERRGRERLLRHGVAATGDKDRAVRAWATRGGGGWSAASVVRWRAATQLSRARDTSVRAPARSAAHGWRLHVRCVEAGRLVAVVDGDDNSAAAVATGTLSEHALGVVGLSGQ